MVNAGQMRRKVRMKESPIDGLIDINLQIRILSFCMLTSIARAFPAETKLKAAAS